MNLDEKLQEDLSPDIYCLVHNKIVNLEQQCKKQKEVIDKAMKYIQKMFETGFYNDDYYLGHLKQILQDKEVSE